MHEIKNIFKKNYENPKVNFGTLNVECPSNIALIKYWGKYENQIPANTSLSFTLKNSKTYTEFSFKKDDEFYVKVFLDEVENKAFSEKIEKYFKNIQQFLPYILDYSYTIETENTFPHSSGIASSASGFGAIAKALIKMENIIFPNSESEVIQNQKISFLARLGSGSACRSIYNGLVFWGKHKEIESTSNEVASPFEFKIHNNFYDYKDCILLIHEGQKTVSSSVGHNLMNNHDYAENRFKSANENIKKIIPIIENGDYKKFIQLVEQEALTLHSMMLMSNPPFILMKPNTLICIEKIWEFRKKTNSNICFTLDAGANIHVLYPKKEEKIIENFIKNELSNYCQNENYIIDEVQY